MNPILRTIASTLVACVGVSISLAVLGAAQTRYPPALAWNAWPDWVIFACLVYTFTALGFGVLGRVGLRQAQPER